MNVTGLSAIGAGYQAAVDQSLQRRALMDRLNMEEMTFQQQMAQFQADQQANTAMFGGGPSGLPYSQPAAPQPDPSQPGITVAGGPPPGGPPQQPAMVLPAGGAPGPQPSAAPTGGAPGGPAPVRPQMQPMPGQQQPPQPGMQPTGRVGAPYPMSAGTDPASNIWQNIVTGINTDPRTRDLSPMAKASLLKQRIEGIKGLNSVVQDQLRQAHDDMMWQHWQEQEQENRRRDDETRRRDDLRYAEEQRRDRDREAKEAKGKDTLYQDPETLDEQGRPKAFFEEAPGKYKDISGQPFQPKSIEKMTTAGAAGRNAAQNSSMINSSTELSESLRTMTSLNIGATSGLFRGLGQGSAKGGFDAIAKNLQNSLSDRESKAIVTRFQGVGRALATLEAAGRATGLVGLTTMSDKLMPVPGDTGIDILGKFAEMRQIAEQNIKAVKTAPGITPQQIELLDQNLAKIQKAVPFTQDDVTDLINDPNKETVRQFAERMKAGKQGGQAGQSGGDGRKRYKVDDIIPGPDGKKYRVTGGDPYDPDIELVK